MSDPSQPTDDLRARVYDALREVIDPELGADVVSLGLIYDVTVAADGDVAVTFTLTTRGCPMERAMRGGIQHAVAAVPGVRAVEANLTWQPRWHSGMMEEGALW